MSSQTVRLMEGATKIWSEYFALNVEGVSGDGSAQVCPHEGGVVGAGGEGSRSPRSPSPLSSSPSSSDSESSTVSLSSKTTSGSSQQTSCLSISVYSAVVVALVLTFLIIGRDYIKYLLLSLEQTNLWVSLLVFAMLFTIVSFPMTWGYIILNIAAGYLYGLFLGVLIVMLCALCGIVIAHLTIRKCLTNFVLTRIANDSMRAIIRVVESEHGFKMVTLSRLTPIPFGLQNAVFAISSIPLHRYVCASMLGMLPSQGMHAYIGSTLRSMEEVISDSGHSATAYAVFIAQLLMAVLLLVFVIRKARIEFDKAVREAEHPQDDEDLIIEVVGEGQDKVKQYSHERQASGGSLPPVHNIVSPRHSVKLAWAGGEPIPLHSAVLP